MKKELKLNRRGPNAAEATFAYLMRQKGYEVTKRGWPDFICWNDEGEVVFVEVKDKDTDELREDQERIMRFLLSRGIRCLRWSSNTGKFGKLTGEEALPPGFKPEKPARKTASAD